MRFTGPDVDDVVDEEDALLKDTTFPQGTVATYSCERGFELLGPARRQCQADSTWAPEGVPFCGKRAILQRESHVTRARNDLTRAYTFHFESDYTRKEELELTLHILCCCSGEYLLSHYMAK